MNIKLIIEQEYKKTIDRFIELGKGGFGRAFEYNGKAYKVTTDIEEVKFAKKIRDYKGELNCFPEIYSILRNKDSEYYIIIRELVSKLKPKVANILNDNNFKILRYVNKGTETDLEIIMNSDIPKDFIEFFIDLRNEFVKLGSKDDIYGLDVKSSNIGITKKGKYVLFDF
jgi:hypothetical protein